MIVRHHALLAVFAMLFAGIAFDSLAYGQQRGGKYRLGSRVEVQEGDVWVPGTVVEGMMGGGHWVSVRLDKHPHGMSLDNIPAEHRENVNKGWQFKVEQIRKLAEKRKK